MIDLQSPDHKIPTEKPGHCAHIVLPRRGRVGRKKWVRACNICPSLLCWVLVKNKGPHGYIVPSRRQCCSLFWILWGGGVVPRASLHEMKIPNPDFWSYAALKVLLLLLFPLFPKSGEMDKKDWMPLCFWLAGHSNQTKPPEQRTPNNVNDVNHQPCHAHFMGCCACVCEYMCVHITWACKCVILNLNT